jgi:hypothetical protein
MDKTNEPDADELAQRIQNRAAGRIDGLLRDAQEVTPQELWNRLWGNGVTEDGFVVAVDPEDMKNASRMGREGQGVLVQPEVEKRRFPLVKMPPRKGGDS